MAYKLQHMGLGGILDQAIAICKDHFGLLFKIMLFLYIPFTLVMGSFALAITPRAEVNGGFEDFRRNNELQQQAFLSYWPFFLSVGLISILIYPVTNAAVIQAVSRVYLGQPVTAMEAFRHGFKRFVPLVLTSILVWIVNYIGFLLCIIPGMIFWVWFGLSQQVVVLEGISGSKAMGRSKKLVSRDWVTFLVLSLVLFVVTFAINISSQFIPQRHIGLIVSVILQAATTILWAASFVVFYFSARCGLENFDLHYLAEAIGEEPPAAAGAPLQ